MESFKFFLPGIRETDPGEWLRFWAAKAKISKEVDYETLIANYKNFTADDFATMGKWKDSARSTKRWQQNIASVAYAVWMQAGAIRPQCPTEESVRAFLRDWANRDYVDNYRTGPQWKRFGVSRATTLLHFISGGEYPIFNSRVIIAISRLGSCRPPPYTIDYYVGSHLPMFKELLAACSTEHEPSQLHKALVMYGSYPLDQLDYKSQRRRG